MGDDFAVFGKFRPFFGRKGGNDAEKGATGAGATEAKVGGFQEFESFGNNVLGEGGAGGIADSFKIAILPGKFFYGDAEIILPVRKDAADRSDLQTAGKVAGSKIVEILARHNPRIIPPQRQGEGHLQACFHSVAIPFLPSANKTVTVGGGGKRAHERQRKAGGHRGLVHLLKGGNAASEGLQAAEEIPVGGGEGIEFGGTLGRIGKGDAEDAGVLDHIFTDLFFHCSGLLTIMILRPR